MIKKKEKKIKNYIFISATIWGIGFEFGIGIEFEVDTHLTMCPADLVVDRIERFSNIYQIELYSVQADASKCWINQVVCVCVCVVLIRPIDIVVQ